MIELNYAAIDADFELEDIPKYYLEDITAVIDFLNKKTLDRRGEYVLLVCAEDIDQLFVDESSVWMQANILPLFAGCKIIHIHEFYSYQEAYIIALAMKEPSALCYEPKK